MKIGLYDVDSKIPNLPLMKLSAWHKQKGDQVEKYSPLFHFSYDKIYASKVFFDSNKGYLRNDMIIGGSGYNLTLKLSHEIEHIYPDYDLYNCKHAMGFITRGCIRKCGFCIVPRKEGYIRKNADLSEFCKEQEKVMLLDNNILAYENHFFNWLILLFSDMNLHQAYVQLYSIYLPSILSFGLQSNFNSEFSSNREFNFFFHDLIFDK